MKISTKLTIVFMVISLIPIAVFSTISINTSKKAIKHSIGKSFENLAAEKAGAIANIIEERISETITLAQKSKVINAVREANKLYVNKSEEEIYESIHKADVRWIESKGKDNMAKRLLDNSLSIFLKEYKRSDPAKYGEIFVTDVKGAVLGMSKILSDYYQADEQWWRYTFDERGNTLFIDDRGYDESVRSFVVGVIVPVRYNGKVIGILKINYKINKIFEIVTSGNTGKSDYTFLTRSQGSVIIHSKEGNKVLSDHEKRLSRSKSVGYSENLHRGIKTIMGYSPVSTKIHTRVSVPGERKGISGEKWEPTTWCIFIEMDLDEAFAPIRELKQSLIIISFVIAFFIGMLVVLFVKTLSTPVKRLTEGAVKIAEGELNYRIEVQSKDEIGLLSQAFNEMVVKLRNSIESLKQNEADLELLVRKRTLELQKANELLKKEVSEREQTEIYLMEKKSFIDSLLYSSTEIAIAATDMNFRIIYYNPLAEKIFGYTATEVAGKSVMEMHTKENVEHRRFERAIEIVKKEGVYKYTVEQEREGEIRIIDSRVSGILDKTGNLTGFVLMSMDVTDRKRIENELIKMNKALEESVSKEVESRKQKEELLVQQSKMAVMGEMIGAIAHQWRQPLNALSIMIQDIGDAYDYGELDRKYINNTIRESLKQIDFMSGTIDDFRNFHRPSKDKEVFDTVKAVKSALSLQEAQLKHNDIYITMNSGKGINSRTEGYPNEFKQVILNLTGNAKSAILEAREEGVPGIDKGVILINMYNRKNSIVIEVSNRGKNIPENLMERIFEPYFTTKNREEGTGIGLYMSRIIIENNMFGRLYAENIEGGVKFTIELSLV